MVDTVKMNNFAAKFSRLNEHNQKYIIAIQQALMYAQENHCRICAAQNSVW